MGGATGCWCGCRTGGGGAVVADCCGGGTGGVDGCCVLGRGLAGELHHMI